MFGAISQLGVVFSAVWREARSSRYRDALLGPAGLPKTERHAQHPRVLLELKKPTTLEPILAAAKTVDRCSHLK